MGKTELSKKMRCAKANKWMQINTMLLFYTDCINKIIKPANKASWYWSWCNQYKKKTFVIVLYIGNLSELYALVFFRIWYYMKEKWNSLYAYKAELYFLVCVDAINTYAMLGTSSSNTTSPRCFLWANCLNFLITCSRV